MENQKLFNTWKAQVEEIDPTCQLDCLRIIEVNLSNVCNFKCPFCPQSKDWPIKDPKFMSLDTAKEISKQLKSFDFQGYICTAGFGEPALNPQFMEILEAFKGFNIVIVSNGALRSSKDWEHLSSFAQIKISVHYWDKLRWYQEKFEHTNAWFRNHDIINPEMNIYNRAGALGDVEPIYNVCNYPFYKIFIDTDGTYLRCEADWSRNSARDLTIFNTSISKYFTETLEEDRAKMIEEPYRQNFESCKYCDINGRLTGTKFIDYWKLERYNNDILKEDN